MSQAILGGSAGPSAVPCALRGLQDPRGGPDARDAGRRCTAASGAGLRGSSLAAGGPFHMPLNHDKHIQAAPSNDVHAAISSEFGKSARHSTHSEIANCATARYTLQNFRNIIVLRWKLSSTAESMSRWRHTQKAACAARSRQPRILYEQQDSNCDLQSLGNVA